MIIRKYRKTDVLKIENLGNLLHNNYKFLLDEFSDTLVIDDTDEIVGFIVYSIIYDRAEIVDMIIAEKKRKQGYGYCLLNYCIEKIKNKNCNNITLEVNTNNTPAINLYKKLGFDIVATRSKYYNDQDGYLMKKDLR